MEEWAKLSYSEKNTYVYMKRKNIIMTSLGNRKFQSQTSLGVPLSYSMLRPLLSL